MQLNDNFLRRYLELAPAALAIERSMECELLREADFGRPILDIGCGDGIFASVLTPDKLDVGVDINAKELEHARSLDVYQELIACKGSAIPKPDESFQTILSNSVLEHIPDLLPVLREAYRLLSPEGLFYVTVPSDSFQRFSFLSRGLRVFGLARMADRYEDFYNSFWRHFHCYDVKGWSSLFTAAGFKIRSVQPYNPANSCTRNDLLVFPAVPSFFVKKAFNRWFAVPRLRRVAARFLYFIFRRSGDPGRHETRGGLLFFTLSKSACENQEAA